MSESSIEIDYVLWCDDVRREDTGKFFLIGLYTREVGAPKFPIPLGMSVFIRGRAVGVGPVPFSFQVVLMPGDLVVGSLSGVAAVSRENSKANEFDITLGVELQLQREGHLELQLKQHNGEWRSVGSVPISLVSIKK